MFKNRKGAVPVAAVIALAVMGAAFTRATVETAQNGVLKNNGKKIWCKMQNKGNDYCDALYSLDGAQDFDQQQ